MIMLASHDCKAFTSEVYDDTPYCCDRCNTMNFVQEGSPYNTEKVYGLCSVLKQEK